MMKRIFILMLAMLTVFSMSACAAQSGSGNKNDPHASEIDSASVSQSIVAPQYTIKRNPYNEPLRITDWLVNDGDIVYYAGYNDGDACLCSFDFRNSQRRELFSSGTADIVSFTLSSDGLLLLLSDRETELREIKELTLAGEELRRFDLSAVSDGGGTIREIVFAQDLLFALSSSGLAAYSIKGELKEVTSREVSSNAHLSKNSDGEIILGQAESSGYRLLRFDGKKSWETIAAFNTSFGRISCGTTWDFYLDDSHALYGYSVEKSKLEKLFSWNALGLISGKVLELPDGTLASAAHVNVDGNGPLVFLEKTGETSLEVSTIRLATTSEYLDYRIQDAIREWNSHTPNHPIEVINYSVFQDNADPRAIQMKIAADIASGNIPDIYDFSMVSIDTIPSAGQYARRGMLENLYPYIDNDPELSREDFFSGVLRSLEISGGLYELVPEFSLSTTFAYSPAVGDPASWTYEQLKAVVTQNEHYETLFDNHYDRSFWLGNVIAASGEKLINWETGECYFDSDYFRSVLETAKTIPEEGLTHEYSTLNKDVQNSTALLYYCNIGDAWMASIAPAAFGEDYSFVGFPELGNVIYPSLSFGISSLSSNKQECWAFLRQFLTEDYNTKFFLSPRRDGMQEQIDRSWADVVKDGNDKIHPHGLEAMNKLVAIIEDADIAARHDSQIWQIVWSEVGAFFAGQRSLDDTVKLIQSRAQIYMSEQS